jgi:hypothetical protein
MFGGRWTFENDGIALLLCGSVGYYLEFTMSFRTETLLGHVQVKSAAGGLFDEMSYLAKKRKKKKKEEKDRLLHVWFPHP